MKSSNALSAQLLRIENAICATPQRFAIARTFLRPLQTVKDKAHLTRLGTARSAIKLFKATRSHRTMPPNQLFFHRRILPRLDLFRIKIKHGVSSELQAH